MRIFRILALSSFALAATVSAASADVQLTLQNGRVSLVARDATLRQILADSDCSPEPKFEAIRWSLDSLRMLHNA